MDARSLASVIGEEELSPDDKQYLQFGKEFEAKYVNQGPTENRSIEQSLDLGWELLTTLPRSALDRVDDATLDQYYEPAKKRMASAGGKAAEGPKPETPNSGESEADKVE